MSINYKDYGDVLPWNDKFLDTSKIQPRDEDRLNFFSFTPWQYIREPVQVPGQLHSFWTLIYSNAWFDTEPKFLHYTDWDKVWWSQYWAWRTGRINIPRGENPFIQCNADTGGRSFDLWADTIVYGSGRHDPELP